MAGKTHPFLLPKDLPPALATVHQYWKDLMRRKNPMPFSDDVNLFKLPELSSQLLMIDVFAPQRFRFNHLGSEIISKFGSNVTGKFADELELHHPLDYTIAQSSVTVEALAPTLYSCDPVEEEQSGQEGYSRLLLPTWGNGKVELLLGAVVFNR
jgi:hypothetical protein